MVIDGHQAQGGDASRAEQDNYPPFDIEKLGDDTYRITIAVAGFKRDEIDIVAQQNLLEAGRIVQEIRFAQRRGRHPQAHPPIRWW